VFTSRLSGSGRFVADVLVSLIRNSPQEVAATLQERGYLIEWAEDRLIIVNVEDEANFEQLIDFLLPDFAAPSGLSGGAR
jgi:hypothetical protein